jgi:hypothetical protein
LDSPTLRRRALALSKLNACLGKLAKPQNIALADVAVSVLAALVALGAAFSACTTSRRANKLLTNANQIAAQANDKLTEANDIAREANDRMSEANDIARTAIVLEDQWSTPRVVVYDVVPNPDNTYYYMMPLGSPDAGLVFYAACAHNLRLENLGGGGAAITGFTAIMFYSGEDLELPGYDRPFAEASSGLGNLVSIKVLLVQRPEESLPLSAWEHPLLLEDLSPEDLYLLNLPHEFDGHATDIFSWTSFVSRFLYPTQSLQDASPFFGPVDIQFLFHLSTGETVSSPRVRCISP